MTAPYKPAQSNNTQPSGVLPPEVIANVISLHQAGHLSEAETLYKKLLETYPANAEIYNLLGTLQLQKDNPQEAIRLLQQAVSIHPGYAEAYSKMGIALFSLKRYDDAVASYDKAIAATSDSAEAHNNRAFTLFTLKRYNDALAGYGKAIAINPQYTEAYVNRGLVFFTLKKYHEALADYDKVLALHPHYAEVHNNRGNVLRELTQYEKALASFNQAIALKPDYAEPFNNRGLIFLQRKQYQEALADYDKALTLHPHYAEAFNNRGATLHKLKQYAMALRDYDSALAIQPDNAEAYDNKGSSLTALSRHEEALECFNRAIALKPDFAETYNHRGAAFAAMKQYQKALTDYDAAIVVDPNCSAYWNKSLLKLLLGEYEEGWVLYEWRWKGKNPHEQPRAFGKPYWLGKESLKGKTLFIHTEQGLGDSIQFCRYVPMVEALGAKVILEVPPPLMKLTATLKGTYSLLAKDSSSPEFDMCCPLMSLPLALKTTLDTIPANVPYLFTDKDNHTLWKDRLGDRKKPRIGLAYSGNPQHANDLNRTIPLRTLTPLLGHDFEYHLVQKDIRAEDAEFLEKSPIFSHAKELTDFTDAASVVSEMDIIISVDTSIAHLAGALGKPVWILISFAPDWRWMVEREDTPWYPTARLFRQQKPGDWAGVIDRVKAELTLLEAS